MDNDFQLVKYKKKPSKFKPPIKAIHSHNGGDVDSFDVDVCKQQITDCKYVYNIY